MITYYEIQDGVLIDGLVELSITNEILEHAATTVPNLTEHSDHWDGDPFCHVDMLEIKE